MEAVATVPFSLPYNQWSLDALQARENQLTAQIQKEATIISEAESSDVSFLLAQKKLYERSAAVLSYASKIIGGAGPIALILTTAFSAPSYSNYIIAGITGIAVPLYHFAEQLHQVSVNYDKQALTAYNNDVLDLGRVKAARKALASPRIVKYVVKKKSEHLAV